MFDFPLQTLGIYLGVFVLLVLALPIAAMSIIRIGPNEVGLVIKRWGREKRSAGPLALRGEAGYQADLLMPGIAFRIWPVNRVEKHPWVQIPTGEIGLVVAQAGAPLPTGWKSGTYKREFGQFTDVRAFLDHGGQQGVQRPVLSEAERDKLLVSNIPHIGRLIKETAADVDRRPRFLE